MVACLAAAGGWVLLLLSVGGCCSLDKARGRPQPRAASGAQAVLLPPDVALAAVGAERAPPAAGRAGALVRQPDRSYARRRRGSTGPQKLLRRK